MGEKPASFERRVRVGFRLAHGELSEVWRNLGVVAERRGASCHSLAAERCRRALAVNPAYSPARANLEALERGKGAATEGGTEAAAGAAGAPGP